MYLLFFILGIINTKKQQKHSLLLPEEERGAAPFKAVLEGMAEYTEDEVMRMLKESKKCVIKPTLVVRMRRFEKQTMKKVEARQFTVSFIAGTKLAQLTGLTDL